MRLAAAEIRKNKVYLHPEGEPGTTVCIRATAVDLLINPDGCVKDSELLTFRTPSKTKDGKTPTPLRARLAENGQARRPSDQEPRPQQTPPYKAPMKTVSFRVYQDEYDSLMDIINSNGYRKAEYLLACVHSAKKKSMEATYIQYYDSHRERRKAEREAAKRYRAEQTIQISV